MKILKHKTKDKEIYTATTIGRNDKFIHDDIYTTELHYFSDLWLIIIVNSGVKIFWCLLSISSHMIVRVQFGANTISCANCLYSNYMLSTHFRIQHPAYFETIDDPGYLTGSFLL